MDKADLRRAKRHILRALTEDFTYGTRKDGTPLKRPHHNQAIFNKTEGYANFHGTDLTMVMESVITGLYLALEEQERQRTGIAALIELSEDAGLYAHEDARLPQEANHA